MAENSNYANKGLGEITAEQLEASRHDPRVIALHAKADKHRDDVERQRYRCLQEGAKTKRPLARLVCILKGHIINDRSTGCYKCKRCTQSVWYPCRVDHLR